MRFLSICLLISIALTAFSQTLVNEKKKINFKLSEAYLSSRAEDFLKDAFDKSLTQIEPLDIEMELYNQVSRSFGIYVRIIRRSIALKDTLVYGLRPAEILPDRYFFTLIFNEVDTVKVAYNAFESILFNDTRNLNGFESLEILLDSCKYSDGQFEHAVFIKNLANDYPLMVEDIKFYKQGLSERRFTNAGDFSKNIDFLYKALDFKTSIENLYVPSNLSLELNDPLNFKILWNEFKAELTNANSRAEVFREDYASRHYQEAVKAFDAGNYKKAAQEADEVLKVDKDFAPVIILRSELYFLTGNPVQSERLLRDVLNTPDLDVDIYKKAKNILESIYEDYKSTAAQYYSDKDWYAAIYSYEKALELCGRYYDLSCSKDVFLKLKSSVNNVVPVIENKIAEEAQSGRLSRAFAYYDSLDLILQAYDYLIETNKNLSVSAKRIYASVAAADAMTGKGEEHFWNLLKSKILKDLMSEASVVSLAEYERGLSNLSESKQFFLSGISADALELSYECASEKAIKELVDFHEKLFANYKSGDWAAMCDAFSFGRDRHAEVALSCGVDLFYLYESAVFCEIAADFQEVREKREKAAEKGDLPAVIKAHARMLELNEIYDLHRFGVSVRTWEALAAELKAADFGYQLANYFMARDQFQQAENLIKAELEKGVDGARKDALIETYANAYAEFLYEEYPFAGWQTFKKDLKLGGFFDTWKLKRLFRKKWSSLD